MNEKAKAHARRVGEIVDLWQRKFGVVSTAPKKPPADASDAEKFRYQNDLALHLGTVNRAALSGLAAEHANALDLIAELERDNRRLQGDGAALRAAVELTASGDDCD